MESISFWTLCIAAYGAVLSTVAVLWNLIRDYTDKGRLSVTAFIGKMWPDATDRDYLVVTMTNSGRRPLMVKGYGGYNKKERAKGRKPAFVVSPRQLPKMLKPTEYHIEWTHDFSGFGDVERICAWDSLGNEYDVPKKVLRKLQQEYAKGVKQG